MNAFWVSLAVSGALSYPILLLLRKLKSLQVISKHVPESHQRKAGTPNMGGLIIMVGFWAGLVVFATQDLDLALPFLLLSFGLCAIGFVDDYVVPRLKPGSRGLSWRHKLLLQIFICLGSLWLAGYQQPQPLFVGLFVILFYCNAYNFSDGLDALAGSLGLVLSVFFALTIIGAAIAIPLSLAAGLIIFLAYNRPPAKVFMGDTGSLPIGAVFGLLGTQHFLYPSSASPSPTLIGAFVLASIVMIFELVPVPMQIFWVKVFKKKLFPFTPIHHAFERAGWKEFRVVILFVTVQLFGAGAAFLLLNQTK